VARTTRTPPSGRKRRDRKADAPTGQEIKSASLEWIKTFAIAVVVVLFLRTFLIAAFSIPSGSMEDTLLVGDYLMANKAVYGARVPVLGIRTPAFREPRRGEIVVFRPEYNDPVFDVVKRIVAVGGDTVAMRDAALYLNGARQEEPYVRITGLPDAPLARSGPFGYRWHHNHLPDDVDSAAYSATRDSWGPLVVPEGHYMMLGDNRQESLDSRMAGFIPREVITGRPMFLYYSIDRTRPRPFPRMLTAARWDRIGRSIE